MSSLYYHYRGVRTGSISMIGDQSRNTRNKKNARELSDVSAVQRRGFSSQHSKTEEFERPAE